MFTENMAVSHLNVDTSAGGNGVLVPKETPDIHSSSEGYATRFQGAVGSWLIDVQDQILISFFAQLPGQPLKILDVGGGHGQVHKVLREKPANLLDYTLFGSCEESIRRVQSTMAVEQKEIVTGDLLALPFPDKHFDVVVSMRILSHMRDWRGFMRELTRVSRLAVIVDYPVQRSFNFLTPQLFEFKRGFEGNTRNYTVFDESAVIREFETQDFKLQSRRAQFFLPMVLHRRIGLLPLSKALELAASWVGGTRFFGSPVIGLFCRV